MKTMSRPSLSARFTTALVLLPTLGQAHPGHAVFDPTIPPHSGHENAYALLFAVLATTAVGLGFRWVASRKR